jgi:hypothetical protein
LVETTNILKFFVIYIRHYRQIPALLLKLNQNRFPPAFPARYSLNIQSVDAALFQDANSVIKVKVKVTLEQAIKAQRGSRGIALLFL